MVGRRGSIKWILKQRQEYEVFNGFHFRLNELGREKMLFNVDLKMELCSELQVSASCIISLARALLISPSVFYTVPGLVVVNQLLGKLIFGSIDLGFWDNENSAAYVVLSSSIIFSFSRE